MPRRVAPPSDGADACLLCGVGWVEVEHGEGDDVWGELRRCQPGTVGGRPRPESVVGYTCPRCTEAIEEVGVIGRSAMELAIVQYTGAKPSVREFEIGGLRAWAALPAGTPPGREPWAHEDLATIKELIETADFASLSVPRVDGQPAAFDRPAVSTP
jgi:hypothetical protein